MKILSRDSLPESGFAGIREHRVVTDSRLFGRNKKPDTAEGFGNMVYLADAKYKPKGESGMHPHSEIDVISIIVEGRVHHEGSMEHGKNLVAGDVQVQRAGGEGFNHNEINPDPSKNRMLQVWALPEEKGQAASYKFYSTESYGVTRIYGGDKKQSKTFDSHTIIDLVNLKAGENMKLAGEKLSYVITGEAIYSEPPKRNKIDAHNAQEGDLIRSLDASVIAHEDSQLLVVSKQS